MFIAINRCHWARMPDTNQAEHAVLAIAAGDWNEQKTADWLRDQIAPQPS